jgi:hypothetical protein
VKKSDANHALFTEHDKTIEKTAQKIASNYADSSSKIVKEELIAAIKSAFAGFRKQIEESGMESIRKLPDDYRKDIWLFMAKYQEMKEMLYVYSGTKSYIMATIKEYSKICKLNKKLPSKSKIKELASRAAEQYKYQKTAAALVKRAINPLATMIAEFLVCKQVTKN